MIEFRTLGTLDLRRTDGYELHTLLAQPKRIALLAYLCIASPRGFHRRDTLLGLFWPDSDEAHARTSLRTTLHLLRKALGDDALLSRGDEEIAVNFSAVWYDGFAFDELILANKASEALGLYRGDLLPGFFIDEAPGFEQWLATERRRFRSSAAHAARLAAETQESQRNLTEAVSWARRAVELTERDERAVRRLVELLVRVGDRAGALKAYDDFASRLAAEFEAQPSDETRALAEGLRRVVPTGQPTREPVPETSAPAVALGGQTGTGYEIDREIGRGGTGTVFLARDLKHKRSVALKILRPEVAVTLGTKRFLAEISIAAGLHHPNIVTLLDSGEIDGRPFYTMPYVEGETLRARLRRDGPLQIDDSLRIARDVAHALSYAHAHGVVHRDVKPENILLESGRALVTDFGIARAITEASSDRLTETGLALGTAAYMSPEQSDGSREVDVRTDIYSLGCVVYEMLTGDPPFSGSNKQALLARKLTEQAPPLHNVRESVSPDLEQCILKALARTPADRFQSVEEFSDSILSRRSEGANRAARWRRLADPEAAMAQGAGSDAVSGSWPKRILVGTSAALVAGLVFLGFQRYRPQLDLDPNLVVIAPFQNKTGDPQLNHLSTTASDWVIQGINETGVADIAAFAPTRDARGRIVASELEPGALTKSARSLGAGRFVTGEYYVVGDSVQFRARIWDAQDGGSLGTVTPSGAPRAEGMTAINAMRARVMGSLSSLSGLEMIGSTTVDAPPDFAAFQEFARGEEAFLKGDLGAAISHYTRANALDTNYLAPLVRAGYVYYNLAECSRTDSLGRILNTKRDRLSPYQAAFLDRALAWCRGDWNASYLAAKRMAEIAPKSSFARYVAARSARPINRPREAVKGLEEMNWRKPHTTQYYVDLTAGLHSIREYRHELEVAQHFRQQYAGSLWALASCARALSALGRVDEVRHIVSESLTMPSSDLMTPADVLATASDELTAHGHPEAGREVGMELVRWVRGKPEVEQNDTLLIDALLRAKKNVEARAVAKHFLTENPLGLSALIRDGITAARVGDRAGAERASAALGSLRHPYMLGSHAYGQALIAALLGQKDRAVELLRESIRQGLSFWPLTDAVPELLPLRDYPPYQELVRPKG